MLGLVGQIIPVIAPIIAVAVLWGKMSNRLDNVEKELVRFRANHVKHFEHSSDNDAHWTERERDWLAKDLDEIKQKLDNLDNHRQRRDR